MLIERNEHKLKEPMRKLTTLLIAFSSLLYANAQNGSEMEKALAEVGLTQDELNHISDGTEAMKNYAFKVRSEESNSFGDKTIREMAFDPRKPVGNQWTLISVDGKAPTQEQLDAFNKEKNDEDNHIEKQDDDLVQEKDVWIEENTTDKLVLGFTFNKKKLHHSQKILKHFKARLTINKKNKSIEDVELYSFESFTMLLVMKIEEMKINLKFKAFENGDELLEKSVAEMTLKMMGQEGNATVDQTYYDYEQVL